MTRRRRTHALLASAGLVASLLAVVIPGGDAAAITRGLHRIAGFDRYQTSVDISIAAFPDGAATAVVASGTTFPDGLSAGPLAARRRGPVLLTPQEGLPPQVADELRRLRVTDVLVVGGPAAVSDVVLEHIVGATGVPVRRIAGPDRYATSALVAAEFPVGARTAVASGADFPDALAGGAAAAIAGGPLVLVAPDSLPDTAAAQLARLAPPDIRVLGGSSAVSHATFDRIARFAPVVRRIHGNDRWATAAAVARDAGAPPEAIIANGFTFPDALSAAGLAAVRRAPILLTDTSCAPTATVDTLRGFAWPDLTVVGGTSTVRPLAGSVLPCRPVPDGLLAPGVTFTTQVLPGPRIVHILTVDRRQGYEIRPTTATGRLTGRLRVSEIGRRWNALGAVNGGFFRGDGTPSFPFAETGRLLRFPGDMPSGERSTVVGFDPAKTAYGFVGVPEGWVRLDLPGDVKVNVGRVNQGPPISDEAVILTPESGDRLEAGLWCRAVFTDTGPPVLDAGGDTVQPKVVQSAGCGLEGVPRQTDVAVAPVGSVAGEALARLKPGDPVGLRWRMHPTSQGVLDAIGGNVTLVFGGEVSAAVREGYGRFFTERADRTAIAQRPNGDLLLVTVDGRQEGYSIGMTIRELADLLVGLGAIDAANLDGGGSTAMAVDGVLVNRPSDAAGERAVGQGLVVVPRGTPAPRGVRAAAVVGGNPELDAASLGGYRASSAG